ncbi:MAG: hypothetical protein M1823_005687 [Watsoniomyces obsoletus]|nr:MAG: hypothetical protein M1823_005687 [Watsoniomyces obsoletus]
MDYSDDKSSLKDGTSTSKENGLDSFASDSNRLRRRAGKEPCSPMDLQEGGRRLSGLSHHSVDESEMGASTMDGLLHPQSVGVKLADPLETPSWHSAPLAFALLPAVAGLLFQNGSAIVTDVTLLALAGVFLNWSVRMPWDWYRSAQSVEVVDAPQARAQEHDVPHINGTATPGPRRRSADAITPESNQMPEVPNDARQVASAELRAQERLALLSCFLLPLAAAFLLHAIRGQLSRPSEGLVSNYNLTIFLLASEMRPLAHLLKMIQARTLHLQRSIHSNPFAGSDDHHTDQLAKRLEKLEARVAPPGRGRKGSECDGINDSTATVTSEVRRSLQPDLDALNRAVRRYEKRATVQTMQTEARLQDLEARLHDAIALAAAAAQSGQQWKPKSGNTGIREYIWAVATLPIRTMVALVKLPAKASTMILGLGRALMLLSSHRSEEGTSDARARPNGRAKERPVKKAGKRVS